MIASIFEWFDKIIIFNLQFTDAKRSILDVSQGCEYASGAIVQAQLFI